MNFTLKPDQIIDGFITDFAESRLTTGELQAFSELKEMHPEIKKTAYAGLRVHTLLKRTKKVKASPGFEQRMAARFAMELHQEETELNKKMNDKQQETTVC